MYISSLVIRNFRNFQNATFQFQKGVNTIIGENGSGKTNAFFALRMLLDNNLPRYTVNLRETDFNRSLGKNWKGHWIVISINLEELSYDEIIQCLAVHEAGIPDGSARGNYNFYFRPKVHIRKKLYDLSIVDDRDEDAIKEALSEILITDYEPIFTVGAQNIDFEDDDFYEKNVGDFDDLIFPNPEEEPIDELGQYNRLLNIYNEISCTFAEALRNVVADLKSYRNNPLLTLLSAKENEIDEDDKTEIQTTIRGLNEKITGLPSVKKVSTGILNTVKNTVGETYAPLVDLEANLPEEMSGLLRSLTLKVGDGDDPDYKGRIEELSLGGANLIYISLKILEYHLELKKDKAAHFLMIEEPEAHIHTHIQKTLFEKINLDKTQIIYSTHSTHISEVSAIGSVNILSKDVKQARVFHPSSGLTPDETKRIERYLDATRSTLLFAKSVMLVEGDAELILLPTLIKQVYGVSIDELGISLINVGSTSFTNIANIFHEDRVQKKCAIVTDLDVSLIKLAANAEDDNAEQKSYRESQKSGLDRKNKLDKYTKDNTWVKAFYAKYTFEVELIKYPKNEDMVCEVLPAIYKKATFIASSKTKLESENLIICGKEILRLAKKYKKGWFALELSIHATPKSEVPEYINDALVFIKPKISSSTLKSIMKYRLEKSDNDYSTLIEEINSANLDEQDEIEKVHEKYSNVFKNDFVSKLLELQIDAFILA